MMFSAYQNLFVKFLTEKWHQLNHQYLGGRLQPPVFVIAKKGKNLGSWDARTRHLSISEYLLQNHGTHEVIDVLKHEMAHQYADEILGVHKAGETAHGQGFRHACQMLGILHSAQMSPTSDPSPILVKIRKLLALAGSQNEHEAAAAMEKARELMQKYELELLEEPDDFCYQFLGLPRKKRAAVDQLIASTLVAHFHIQVVWIPSQRLIDQATVWLLEACGSKSNLEVAHYVYDYLKQELDWLWHLHQRQTFRPHGVSLKREYQLGVMRGFMLKLEERKAQEAPPPGQELVLLRQARLEQFFADRHPSMSRGRSMSWRETETFRAGFAQGQSLELRKGMGKGATKGKLPQNRLLE